MGQEPQALTTDLVLGACAGGVATLVMGKVTGALYSRENPSARRREDRARGGRSAHEIAAERIAASVGVDLKETQAATTGTAIHYGLGSGSGAIYGAVRRQIPAPAPVRGLAFGMALWLIADEVANPVLGLTPGPGAFPWQAHARGLAGHLVFGLVTEGILSAADRIRGRQSARETGGDGQATGRSRPPALRSATPQA